MTFETKRFKVCNIPKGYDYLITIRMKCKC